MGDTDNEKRSSVFTVRDAESAMLTFTVFAIAVVVGFFLHEIVLKRNSITDGLYAIAEKRVRNSLGSHAFDASARRS